MQLGDVLWAQLRELKAAWDDAPSQAFAVLCDPDTLTLCNSRADASASSAVAVISTARLDKADMSGRNEMVLISERLWLYAAAKADSNFVDCIRHYVPLCMAPQRHDNLPFVIVHMAQSLDGRVSTESGDSQWIGNPDNLTHSHRMRALVDGVLVGGNTARQDLPQLSVRHVEGTNPARIIFSDTFEEIESLPDIDDRRTILLCSARRGDARRDLGSVETIYYDASDGVTDIPRLLASLRAAGLRSILVEGGPVTFRSFLDAGAVDWLQVHIAPIILGSGKPLVTLPRLDSLEDARALGDPFSVAMGDAVMMTGSL